MEDYPRIGKRCENEYRFNKKSNLCHRREQTTPIESHNSRYFPRTGKRCKAKSRYNKSKKLCASKLYTPSPVRYESYERLGKRCKRSYRHHKPSGLCVYTKKKRKSKPRVTREAPLPIEQQGEIVESPFNSPVEDKSVLYSPVSPIETTLDNPVDQSVLYSPDESVPSADEDNSVLYSPESPKKEYENPFANNL
jgi:hypothetical protein